ncbi:MAG: hypothetical protein LQ346_009131 [Caloplaca aetnensis]|nr:MAG: hypothetical protein LQ346_009131 [Caloplaca aetnensis]
MHPINPIGPLHNRGPGPSDRSVLIDEVDVPRPKSVPGHELLVARRPLVLGVPRQHALDAHADAFDVLDGRPALRAEQV